MSKRFKYLVGYLAFWSAYFIFCRAVFLIYHFDQTQNLDASTLVNVFFYGFRLDLSFTAYLAAIPFLAVVASVFLRSRFIRTFLLIYTDVLLILVTIIISTDLELFRIWGFRIDATPLNYLNTPNEMMASIGSSPIFSLILINSAINILFFFIYKRYIDSIIKDLDSIRFYYAPLFLFLTATLIIPMRGGLQLIPINQSSVFFSNTLYANQAGINPAWNFFHSVSKRQKDNKNPYLYLKEEEAKALVEELHATPDSTISILNQQKPNVVLIIWESLTAKAVEKLGGVKGATPRFNKLSEEGILFTNIYASGDRSDKGLVAIMSGYPTQPISTIMKTPKKTAKLPFLSKALDKAGYNTSFYYGGELGFANLGSYLRNGGYETIIGVESFNEEDLNSKWGAHDHVLFKKVFEELNQKQAPFFATIFTLSSHEPFDIPTTPKFGTADSEKKFLSSHYYTDSTLGAFIDKAKTTDWYKNTLFIIIADHGHTYPGKSQVFEQDKFHIPMLWLGGALKTKGIEVAYTGSQTDLAATLLSQLNLPTTEFTWSKNILAPNDKHFAHYFFKDGVGIVTDSSYLSFDNTGKFIIEKNGKAGEEELTYAKAYLQEAYGDYLKK